MRAYPRIMSGVVLVAAGLVGAGAATDVLAVGASTASTARVYTQMTAGNGYTCGLTRAGKGLVPTFTVTVHTRSHAVGA